MKKLAGILVFVLIIGAIGVFAFTQIKPFGITSNSSSEASLVQDRILEISELATLKYEYRNVIISETDKSLSMIGMSNVKYAEAIKLIDYTGYLKAGSDVSKIETSYDEESGQLFVRVPKAEILENVAETEEMIITDVKGDIFSDYPSQKFVEEINAEKEKLKKEKIEQGFLDETDKRTEVILTSLLSNPAYSEVIIEFY